MKEEKSKNVDNRISGKKYTKSNIEEISEDLFIDSEGVEKIVNNIMGMDED